MVGGRDGARVDGLSIPETRYARSGDVNIAYQVVGEGPLDLVWIPSTTHHVELAWESPAHARHLRRLASTARLIVFDKRGTGMSDRPSGRETLEVRMDDIRAVLDVASSERAVVFGLGDGGPLCILFAATYPERTSGLVLMHSTPRFVRSPELPWLPTRAEMEQRADEFARRWGEQDFHDEMLQRNNPSLSDEERLPFTRVFRLSVSPGAAAAYLRMNLDVDVRDVLPLVRVPSSCSTGRRSSSSSSFPPATWPTGSRRRASSSYLAGTSVPWSGTSTGSFRSSSGFSPKSTKVRRARPSRTVCLPPSSSPTSSAQRRGPQSSATAPGASCCRSTTRRFAPQLGRFRGREVDTAGDGFFATFDGPARAIRCACAVRDSLGELDVDVRAGLHTGECELLEQKVGGIAVHIGARVVSQAEAGEVLVSSTVKDLVAGSGIEFEDRGLAELKGVPGEWRLYAVREVPVS